MASVEIPWRNTILTQLQQRNKTQTYCFQGLIQQCNKLFDTANLQPFQGDKYNAGQTTTQADSKTSEAIENLNHKLLTQQEELTEMHRRKGENAQNIIDLNNKLQEKEQEIAEQNIRLKEASNLNVSLQSQINRYSSNIKELEKINFTLRDEHTTLRLEHSSLEEKLRKVQDENRQLMDGLISYKSKDADKLNEENDNFVRVGSKPYSTLRLSTFGLFRKKHAKVQKDLEDACKDSKGASVEDAVAPVYMGISSLPKRATLTFEAHEGEIYAVKYNPVDRMLATGGSDRKIKLWNVTTGVPQKVGILSGNSGGVNDIDFSATGSLLIGACSDRASRIWTVRDQRVISVSSQ